MKPPQRTNAPSGCHQSGGGSIGRSLTLHRAHTASSMVHFRFSAPRPVRCRGVLHAQRLRHPFQSHEGAYQHQNLSGFTFFPPVSDLLVINHSCCFAIGHFLGADLNIKQIVANATMFQALTGYHSLFGVYWTLFVELVFYALCVVLNWNGLLDNLKVRYLVAITLLIAALAGTLARHYLSIAAPVGILSSLSLMLFGGIWRSHITDHKPNAKAYSLQWIILFLLCFPLIAFLAYNADQGLGENAYTHIGSYFAALLFFTSTTTLLKLKNKTLIFLGTISYSLYLIHPFFLEWVTARSSLTSTFNLAPFALYLLATLACSMTCYFLIEKNGIRLGRRLNSALDRTALKSETPPYPIPSSALVPAPRNTEK